MMEKRFGLWWQRPSGLLFKEFHLDCHWYWQVTIYLTGHGPVTVRTLSQMECA